MLLDKEIKLSPAEFQAWKEHPGTQIVLEALSKERSLWVERLAWGDTIQRPGLEIRETAVAVGTIQGLATVLEGLEIYLIQQWEEAQKRKEEESEEEDGD